jgi:C4-dicarboxylate-specific signal transduction histidine kinase
VYLNDSEKVTDVIKDKSHHIGAIISVQQQYAKLKKGIKTTVSVGQVFDDCLMINESRISKPYLIINRDLDDEFTFVIEKNSFIQILSNAIINAVESIEEKMNLCSEFEEGVIKISSEINESDLILIVSDNGIGFDDELKKKLFQFGFSTKKRSSGFGLHNCMNFMKTQGGSFEIDSDGLRKGAYVKIIIPLKLN